MGLCIVWIFNNENKYICSQEKKMDEKMDINWMYCGHHFKIYVNQTIILHMLSLYSYVCQLFLNKTAKIVG